MSKRKIGKLELIKEIIKKTNNIKIKSFKADGIDYDFRNLKEPDFYLDKNIKVSNKYIPLLCENFELDFVLTQLDFETKDISIISNELKFLHLDITIHAFRRFIKRFIYMYLDEQNKFDFSNQMKIIFENNIEYILNTYLENSLTDIKKDDIIIKVITDILKMAKIFNPLKNSGRHRDIKYFKRRLDEHKNTTMYLAHPFLFIVEDANIITIELYSSSYSMFNANKTTALDKVFKRFLTKRLGDNIDYNKR